MSKITVRVTTADAELEFTILPFTYGKELFDQVVKAVGLREAWYFGLEFEDKEGCISWLRLNKKIMSQDVVRGDFLEFRLRAKFYPENMETEIIQPITLRYFYLQVKELILTDALFCPADKSVVLASYAMQVKYGDYVPEVHRPGFLTHDRLVPNRVRMQHKQWSFSEWERRVMLWWQEHKEMRYEAAMMEYLSHAEDLEMYGLNYFDIKNRAGSELYLGVDARGLHIYRRDNQLIPETGFHWSEIRDISFDGKKFRIKCMDKDADNLSFYTDRVRTNKRIMVLCMGNHELYLRRRRPETVEVKQMKDQAAMERAVLEAERQRLREETVARESAEHKQRVAENEVAQLRRIMASRDEELMSANEKIRNLEEQASRSVTEQSCLSDDKSVGSVHADLTTPPEGIQHEELNRVSIIEQQQKADMKEKMQELAKDLDAVRDVNALTQLDIVYMGKRRDKYETLRHIQKGNTQMKVDLFEHM